ncbi:MAG: transposase [Planctomycetota bacterium]
MTDHPKRFADLVARLSRFTLDQLDAVDKAMQLIEAGDQRMQHKPVENAPSGAAHEELQITKSWPRAPIHQLSEKGTFIVTAGTLHKRHTFRDPISLTQLESTLLQVANQFHWHIEAWAVFSNHYHFVGHTLESAESLRPMLTRLHSETARWANERDGVCERKAWHNFWETRLTYQKSYQARLHYVHANPVHHQLVKVANQYRWCSAAWFERTATPAQVKSIYSFKIDRIKVMDEYEPRVE